MSKRSVRGTIAQIGLAVALAVGLGAVVLSPVSPASAAANCTRNACDGKDPSSLDCDSDAVTKRWVGGEADGVELRFSPSCKAAWARFNQTNENCCFPVEVTVVRQTLMSNGQWSGGEVKIKETSIGGAPHREWTKMLGDNVKKDRHQACYRVANLAPDCTDYW